MGTLDKSQNLSRAGSFTFWEKEVQHYLGIDVRKPVFGVSYLGNTQTNLQSYRD